MKPSTKEPNTSTILCKQHKEKCAFVCLFKTCKDAFRIGCMRCRKDHGQHPNRLISLNDFHSMISKPIRYLENLTAFKLMNLKKKIEYIRNFRTDILQKETQLMESNKYIKTTISAILEQHYGITDVVSHIDAQNLVNNYDQYAQNLSKCKEFIAYNPVKCQLVFNNDVIKNSRILLEKHLKTSHELIDNIRQLLVKIIEVLLANCAHDQDDDEIEFAQEGDSATTFNIFIKNRTDVTENPNIKSKLEHQTFLQMFDEQKEAFTKEIQLLEKEINVKSTILKKIKSSKLGDKEQITEKQENSKLEIDLEVIQQLQNQNKQLKYQLGKYHSESQSTSLYRQDNFSMRDSKQYETIIMNKQLEIEQLTKTCQSLSNKLEDLLSNNSNNANNLDLYNNQIDQYQKEILKERDNKATIIKDFQEKSLEFSSIINKQSNELSVLTKKCASLEQEIMKKKQEQQSQKSLSKAAQDDLIKKMNEVTSKLAKKDEQIQKKQKDIQKEKKKYLDLEKIVEKLKENSSSIEKQSQKWRQQYQSREKLMRSEYQKTQKQLQSFKYKSRNDEERIKNLQSRMKDLTRQIEAKTQMIRQKDKMIRQKQQLLQNKSSIHTSRIKDLQNELKSSRTNEIIKNYEEEIRKHKQTKDILQISIKKSQQLKDKIYEFQSDIIKLKNQQENKESDHLLMDTSKVNSKKKVVQENILPVSILTSEQFRIQTVNSQQAAPPLNREEPLKQKKIMTNKQERRLAYLQIKNIFKAVTQDMGILEERLKENNVIEKVYLKELERKRNQNKILKKELQTIKVYGGNNNKQAGQNQNGFPQNSRIVEKDKKEGKSPSPHVNKVETQGGLRKKV